MKRQEPESFVLVVVQVQTAAGCLSSMVEPVVVFAAAFVAVFVAVFATVEHYCCFGLPAAFELKLPPE